MSYCPKCGLNVPDGAKFCRHCGANLPQTGGVPPKKGPQPPVIIAIATLVTLAAAIVIIVAAIKPGTSATSGNSQAESAQASEASSASTSKEKEKEDAATKKADAKKEEEAAREKQRAALREEAEAAGDTVLVGTLHIYDGAGLAEVLGTTAELYANGDKATQAEQNSEYAILALDEPQSLYVTMDPTNPGTIDASYVCLGTHRYNAYNGSYYEDGVEPWRKYEGQHICVAATNFSASDGVSVNTAPTTSNGRFLYSSDEGDSDATESESTKKSEPAQEEDYDPLWYTSTDTTFETADFIINIPEDWAGQWSCVGHTQVGSDAYAWIFQYEGDMATPPYTPKGGGLVVAPTDSEPSISTYAIWKRAMEGKSSHGNSLWFIIGDPPGFFAMDGEPGATITLK